MTSKKSQTPSKAFTPSHVEEEEEGESESERPNWRTFGHLVELSLDIELEAGRVMKFDFPTLVEERIIFQNQGKIAEKMLKTHLDPALQAALMTAGQLKVKVPTLAGQDIKVTLASGTSVSVNGKTVAQVLLEEEKWPASKIEQFLAKVTTRSPYDYMKITPPKPPYQKKG